MYSSPAYYVVVKRLTDGKTVVDQPNGQITPPPCCTTGDSAEGQIVGYGTTTDLVLSPGGAVGWIATEAPLYPASAASAVITNFEGDMIYPYGSGDTAEMDTYELRVYALDGRGEHVLDTSPQVSRGTLRLADNQLSWLDDNTQRTATLGAGGPAVRRAAPREPARATGASLSPRCALHVKGSSGIDRVYARDHQAIVFGVYYGFEDIPTVVGCVFKTGRILKLGQLETGREEPEQPGVDSYLIKLAGDIVAFPVEYHPQYAPGTPDSFRIVAKQLTKGTPLLDEPNGTITPSTCCNNDGTIGYGPTHSLIVTADGAVAWIATEDALYGDVPDGEQTTGEHQVTVHDRNGDRTLDTSTHIATSSLRVSGHTIYWTDGRAQEQATLGLSPHPAKAAQSRSTSSVAEPSYRCSFDNQVAPALREQPGARHRKVSSMHEEPTLAPTGANLASAILSILLDPVTTRPWLVDEVVREAGKHTETLDALAELIATGLVNRCGNAVWASRAALRASQLLT
jgi:hypothetical protein